MADFERWDGSQVGFCEARGVSRKTFQGWRRRFGLTAGKPRGKRGDFVEIAAGSRQMRAAAVRGDRHRGPVPGKALAEAGTPLSQRQIRERAATRHKTVGAVLKKLVREGRVRHDAEGHYSLAADQADNAAPAANGSRPGDARFPVPGSAHP